MRRKIAFGSAAAVVAALVVSTPIVADAARRITGADIVNDNLKSWDVKDGTLQGKDVKNGSLSAEDFAAGTLPVTAYARVTGGPAATLDDARSQNVASVTRSADGVYCLELKAGVDRNVAVLAAAEGGNANQSAQASGNCGANGVQVTTEEQSVNASNALVSNRVNTVSFTVLVP